MLSHGLSIFYFSTIFKYINLDDKLKLGFPVFSRSTKCLGHLITVMYRAVTDDLRRFSIILSILLTAYSLGMTVLFKAGQEGESGSPSPSPFHNFSLTLYLSFCMVMGEVKPVRILIDFDVKLQILVCC